MKCHLTIWVVLLVLLAQLVGTVGQVIQVTIGNHLNHHQVDRLTNLDRLTGHQVLAFVEVMGHDFPLVMVQCQLLVCMVMDRLGHQQILDHILVTLAIVHI